MMELYTKYMGLDLTSPIIAGSCGLTNSTENLKLIEAAGAGAVVLKSVFEEEINLEYALELQKLGSMDNNLEFLDYYDFEIRKENLKRYLSLISDAKRILKIPVIASINCISAREWSLFAQKIESAGADALELNLFILPSDLTKTSRESEDTYFSIINQVLQKVKIPVSIKISYYFSNLGRMITELSKTGISGIVLFNRFYNPDIDIEKFEVKNGFVMSNSADYQMPLRWIGMMSTRAGCDLSASTGIHDWQSAVKMLLAGAQTVQVASVLYKQGFKVISEMNEQITKWMDKHNYNDIHSFRGKLSLENQIDPAGYERVQFMKNFGDYQP